MVNEAGWEGDVSSTRRPIRVSYHVAPLRQSAAFGASWRVTLAAQAD
jgi:hypothetical protein